MSTRCPAPPPASELPQPRAGDLYPGPFTLARIYNRAGRHPTGWASFRSHGPLALCRFDHHLPPTRDHPSRGVIYAAATRGPHRGSRPPVGFDPLPTAVLERFGPGGTIDRAAGSPWLALWTPVREVRLLALSDSGWVARAAGNAALTSGPRAVARDWSRAIYRAFDDLDGLTWSSSVLPPGRCVVLYERARSAVPARPSVNVPLTHPGLQPALARVAAEFGLALV